MSDAVAKIQKLLASGQQALGTQACEMILALEDPDVDAWVLSNVTIKNAFISDYWRWKTDDTQVLAHTLSLSAEDLLRIVARASDTSAAANAVREGLVRLYLEIGHARRDEAHMDVGMLGGLPHLSKLRIVAVDPPNVTAWRPEVATRRKPIVGVSALANLPALEHLTLVGVERLDLRALSALPSLRTLSLPACSLQHTDTLASLPLTRLEITHAQADLASIALPPTLKELHLGALRGLKELPGLQHCIALESLHIEAAPSLESIAPLADAIAGGAPLRNVWLECSALTSIEPLAGKALASITLERCKSLGSLRGFPSALEAEHVSLNGCERIDDVRLVASAAGAVRSLDLRGLSALRDIDALVAMPELRVVAAHGTLAKPETTNAALLSLCTWAEMPMFDSMRARPRP